MSFFWGEREIMREKSCAQLFSRIISSTMPKKKETIARWGSPERKRFTHLFADFHFHHHHRHHHNYHQHHPHHHDLPPASTTRRKRRRRTRRTLPCPAPDHSGTTTTTTIRGSSRWKKGRRTAPRRCTTRTLFPTSKCPHCRDGRPTARGPRRNSRD